MKTRPQPEPVTADEPDWDALRSRFPLLANKTFMNSCSYGAMSTDVRNALQQYIEDREQKGTDWHDWVGRNERVRSAVAALLGAQPDEIALTASASASINSIASALDFSGKRNKVVISDFEFPTSGQIWYAQALRGAEIVRVPQRDGYVHAEDFAEVVDERTLLVATTHVCYFNGAKLDVPAIARIAHDNGAMMLVDGFQGFGTYEFDVKSAGVDFAVGGMLKYLLGSAGMAFLYVRDELIRNLVPTVTGWFAQADIFAMDHSSYDPSPTARRFEAGTPPVPNCYAAEAGLNIIAKVGLPAIEARLREITAAIIEEAKHDGFKIAMPEDPARRAAMVSLRANDENELVAALEDIGIVTSCRGGNLRISPHFYNNFDDVDALCRGLRTFRHLLA